jgi:Uma2 family endonuclease
MLISPTASPPSLEEFMDCPIDRMEWVDGHLSEKAPMTGKTGRIQARLARYWGNYMTSSGKGGEVYVESSCRTIGRVRCPDVAYLSSELVTQFGEFKVLPQSFLLVAEIISPNDEAEEVFAKVGEYLKSGGQEVWLVFPESQWVLVITPQQQVLYGINDTASTQMVLAGFSVPVKELLA